MNGEIYWDLLEENITFGEDRCLNKEAYSQNNSRPVPEGEGEDAWA